MLNHSLEQLQFANRWLLGGSTASQSDSWTCLSRAALVLWVYLHYLLTYTDVLGLPLDAVPDDVADPAEGADAARAPDAALPHHGPRDEVPGRGDLHVARVPGEHRGVLRPEH